MGCEAPEGAQVPPSALITCRLHPTPKPLIQPQMPGKPSQQQGQGAPAGGSQRLRGSPEAEVSWFQFCLQQILGDGWGEGESIGIGKGEMEGYQDRPDLTSASSSPSHQDSGVIREGLSRSFPSHFLHYACNSALCFIFPG